MMVLKRTFIIRLDAETIGLFSLYKSYSRALSIWQSIKLISIGKCYLINDFLPQYAVF